MENRGCSFLKNILKRLVKRMALFRVVADADAAALSTFVSGLISEKTDSDRLLIDSLFVRNANGHKYD